jgi:diguanylate cyclase (GGDEF)-like protein/PAS domain S-box-containing protein
MNISNMMSGDGKLAGQILNRIPDFLCICDQGVIVESNCAAASLLGEKAGQLNGRLFSDIVHPDYRLALAGGLDILTEGTPMLLLRRADGTDANVEIQAVPLSQDVMMVSAHDASARVQAAEGMVESEHRLHRIVDLSMDLIAVWQDERISFINASGAKMLGFEQPAEAIGLQMDVFVHPDWSAEIFEVGLAGLSLEEVPLSIKFCSRDGRTVDVEMSVRPLGSDRQYVMSARDVTAHKRAAESLRSSEQHLRRIMDSVAEAILVGDGKGIVLSANKAAEGIFGHPLNSLRGMSFSNLFRDNQPGAVFSLVLPAAGSFALRADGSRLPIEISQTELWEGKDLLRIAVVRDVSERLRAEERFLYQSTHDPLTELPNRPLFFSRFENLIATTQRRGRKGALLLVNIDGFKLVNDTLGHEMGDRLLQEMSGRLRQAVGTADILARFGADEFVVVNPEIGASYEAAITARRLIDLMEPPFLIEGFELNVSVSIGCALFPDDGNEANDLLKNASSALVVAKEHGRGGFHMFTPDLDERINERMSIRNGLIHALDQSEFTLVYQPKVAVADRSLSGVEGLLRWRSPKLGSISPVKFIPVLEETAQINSVGQWVIEQACLQQRAWSERGYSGIRVAVNLSVRQLRSGLVPMVESVLARTGVDPQMLEIEITESLLMRDTDNAVAMLCALADMGIELSIDDFGTGYSSLSYLKRLPLNHIKIDRSFIIDLTDDADSAEIVRTIIAMGHSLRRKIIAEGVETEEQFDLLAEMGCDEIQGYLFSQPVPADAIEAMIGSKFAAPHHAGQ